MIIRLSMRVTVQIFTQLHMALLSFQPCSNSFWRRYIFFLSACLLCWALPSLSGAAPPRATRHLQPEITVSLAPHLHTTIFNRVAVLPFASDNPELTQHLTQILYEALSKTRKYTLLPLSVTRKRLAALHPTAQEDSIQWAVGVGRAIKARGIIQARLLPQEQPVEKKPAMFAITIEMTDAQTGTTAWRITSRQSGAILPLHVINSSIHRLIQEMVKAGDIFSPVLPQPTIIAAQGSLRATTITIQPDPLNSHVTYQLLGAETPDSIFVPRTAPVAASTTPIILQDTGLQDATTYYYTVIGKTKNGLASIPIPPFSVTTAGPPPPVVGLKASADHLRLIQLHWQASQNKYVTGYVLYRAENQAGPFRKIISITRKTQQSYIDYGATRNNSYGSLGDSTTYYYRISTINSIGVESSLSPIVAVTTKGAPEPPADLRATSGQPEKVTLEWKAVNDVDLKGYSIYRSTSRQGPFVVIDFVRGRQSHHYTDDGSWRSNLQDNTTYFYKIRSLNMLDVASKDSMTISATTKPAPVPVRDIAASCRLLRKVNIQWRPNPEQDISGYEIYRQDINGTLQILTTVKAPATSYTDIHLEDGTTYWYAVRAVDRDGLKGKLLAPVKASTKPRPATPSGISARLTPAGILLTWQQQRNRDKIQYEIFTTGFLGDRIGITDSPTFLYHDNYSPGDQLSFQIQAIDSDGLKSTFSQPIIIQIPR